jgi:inosose dehydratase
LAILADEGAPSLRRNPARSWSDRSLALDDAGWRLLGQRLGQAVAMAAAFGVPTSFHPHIGTYVESPWEVERLLELSDIPLTLDTGHFALAGADPAEALERLGDRVNHIHAKDVRLEVLRRAKEERRADFETWWADVSCPLGQGDVNLEAFLDVLVAQRYEGWIVIEQDRAPTAAAAFADVAGEQAANREWIEAALVRRGADFGGRPGRKRPRRKLARVPTAGSRPPAAPRTVQAASVQVSPATPPRFESGAHPPESHLAGEPIES